VSAAASPEPALPLPAPSGIISLLTDFGWSDPFVGVMTGVILSHFAGARVVDLCHGVRPQAIVEAAFWLERCYHWFPRGTVHVAVVDPGVGSTRRLLAAAIDGHYFLLPDNGLLSPSLLAAPGAVVLSVDVPKLGLPTPSATFHGRDVFAPLAGGLASGTRSFESLGVPAEALPSLLPRAARTPLGVRGEVISVDRYGNLISNVDEELARTSGATHIVLAGQHVPWRRTYADAAPGELLGLVNAFGVIEIAQRDGNAERHLGITRGAAVELIAPAAAPAR
jgi:S-adenosylmethionine hydrolase